MPATNRMDRIDELLLREVAEFVERNVETVKGSVLSVTAVKTSHDLRTAEVAVSILGTTLTRGKALKHLHGARIHLQSVIARHMRIKYTPVLHFKIDSTMEEGDHILQILSEIECGADSSVHGTTEPSHGQ